MFDWLRQLLGKKKPKEEKVYAEVKGWPEKWTFHPPPRHSPTHKPGHQAISKGYGKFFKGKGRGEHYRKTMVKGKKVNEEDEFNDDI